MKQRMSPATGIALVALFFSLGGTGLAASRYLISSTHQIAPSVRHALHGERGPRGFRGFAGGQGIPGRSGPQGVAGPQGPAGTVDWQRVHVVATKAALTSDSPTADLRVDCPSGEEVLSGGFYGDNEIVTANEGNPGSVFGSWEVSAHLDPSLDGGSGQVGAWAACVAS